MDDLEQRLRRGLRSDNPTDERARNDATGLRSEVDRRVRRHARHRRGARSALFVFGLVLVGAGAFVLIDAGSDGGTVSVADNALGWLSVTDPNSGLTAEYPDDWFVQGFDQPCRRGPSGVLISTADDPIRQDVFSIDAELSSCTTAFLTDQLPDDSLPDDSLPDDYLPDDYVAVYIHGPFGAPDPAPVSAQGPITDFPLEIDRPEPAPGGSSTSLAIWTGKGEPDGVAIYVGPFATKRDIDTAMQIAATIQP